MILALPITHVPMRGAPGGFKYRCQWCPSIYATFAEVGKPEHDHHAARVICDGCGRQIAWASASACRKAGRLATLSHYSLHSNGKLAENRDAA